MGWWPICGLIECDMTFREAQDIISTVDLEEMRAFGGGMMDVLSLDGMKLLVDEDQTRINQTMTEMIGKRVSTSL